MLAKIVFLGVCLSLLSCTNKRKSNSYSFFVAGHVYGRPGTSERGLHKPFKDRLLRMDSTSYSFGVLTGDMVQNGDSSEWSILYKDLDSLDVKTHFVLGNHDYKNPDLIEVMFPETYYSFFKKGDLHIVLDANIDRWNISGNQLTFLKETLNEKALVSDNIFVYSHQLLWWGKEKGYQKIRINSSEGRDSNINFWRDVEPLFTKLNNSVYFIAGDIGAAKWADDYSFDSYGNIKLISSGMGEGKGDNFLNVKVLESKEVILELIPLDNSAKKILN